MAPRYSVRALLGQSPSSGAKVALRSSSRRLSAARRASAHAGGRWRPADQGAPHRCDLLEERGPVRHRPLDPGRQGEPGGQPRHVGPLTAELERGHELVEVVHVGEVVEHEAQGDAGPLRHGLGRRVGVAGAQQLHEGLADAAPGPLSPGHPSVAGRLLEGGNGREVERGVFPLRHRVGRAASRSFPLRRPPPRSLQSLESTFLSRMENPTGA